MYSILYGVNIVKLMRSLFEGPYYST